MQGENLVDSSIGPALASEADAIAAALIDAANAATNQAALDPVVAEATAQAPLINSAATGSNREDLMAALQAAAERIAAQLEAVQAQVAADQTATAEAQAAQAEAAAEATATAAARLTAEAQPTDTPVPSNHSEPRPPPSRRAIASGGSGGPALFLWPPAIGLPTSDSLRHSRLASAPDSFAAPATT